MTKTQIAISPFILRALVERDVLDVEDALADVEQLAGERDWLGAPIYRRARELFEE